MGGIKNVRVRSFFSSIYFSVYRIRWVVRDLDVGFSGDYRARFNRRYWWRLRGRSVKTTRERDIEKYLVKRVKELGGEVRKVKWIGRNGAPDRLVMIFRPSDTVGGPMLLGSTLWVELKAPGEKPTTAQLREHTRMSSMGQRVWVIDSLEGVDRMLGVEGILGVPRKAKTWARISH